MRVITSEIHRTLGNTPTIFAAYLPDTTEFKKLPVAAGLVFQSRGNDVMLPSHCCSAFTINRLRVSGNRIT